jgi:hypothetical protein
MGGQDWDKTLPHSWDIDLEGTEVDVDKAIELFAKFFYGKIRPIEGSDDTPVNPVCLYSIHNNLVARIVAGSEVPPAGATNEQPEKASFFHIEMSEDCSIYKQACTDLLPRLLKGETSPV